MRRFRDRGEREWDVVVGRESWGAFFAIFVPRGHDAAVRQSPLRAESQETASREIEEMDRSGLCALLDEAEPKNLG